MLMPNSDDFEPGFKMRAVPRVRTPIYVDEPIFSWRGKNWCHMFCADLDKLHVFAARLGLRRGWFQKPPKASWCHYDLTEAKRWQAIRNGAVSVDRFEASLFTRRLSGTLTADWEARIQEIRSKRNSEKSG